MADWRDDCKVEIIFLATGTTKSPGGQQVGTPAHSIRVTHLPTGTMAQVGEKRSQHRNRTLAYEMLEWALIDLGFVTLSHKNTQ